MNATLRQINSFIIVARYGSFTKAAQALHLSQPGLTLQIRQLERSLGLKLFSRSTHHVRLTEAGADLLPVLQRIVGELESALDNAQGLGPHQRGTIRVACLPSVCAQVLPRAVAAFRKSSPFVSFVIKDTAARHVLALVRSEEVDFGITDRDPKAVDLEQKNLLQDNLQVIYPQGHPIGRMRRATLRAISEFPLVLTDQASSARAIVDEAFAGIGKVISPSCEVSYISTAVGLVEAGQGIAILPALGVNLQGNPQLRARSVDDAPFSRAVNLVYKKGAPLSALCQSFVDALAAEALRMTGGEDTGRPRRPAKGG